MNRDVSPADEHLSAQPKAEGAVDGGAKGNGEEPTDGSDTPKRRAASQFLYSTGDQPLPGYTIKRGLGRGGFGEVYFATSDAGKEVAIKLIRRNLDIELRGVRHCLNLKHQNLIGLFDIRTDKIGDEWVIMEYVAGDSLDQILDRYPNGMPAEEAVAWMRGIAAGVGHLHQNGIVHRDLKPGNLFLEGRQGVLHGSVVKIGDYGLSKFISCSKRSGQTESVGTVHYMAPEIAGGRYGKEIDTYALGIIFYELLTGHVPFEGESVGEVLMKHLTAEPDLSKVEEPYRSIISRALNKDPEIRLASAEELVALFPSDSPAANTTEEASAAAQSAPVDDGVWRPVSTPPHTDQSGPPREPLWQGLVELTDSMREGWRHWDAPALVKGLALFGLVAFALFSGVAWISVGVMLLGCYFVYYIIWSMFLQDVFAAPPRKSTTAHLAPNGRPHANGNSPVSVKPNAKRARRKSWRDEALKQRREIPKRERLRSLVGSMLSATFVAVVLAAVSTTFLLEEDYPAKWELGLWGATLITLGSWAILVSNSVVESRPAGDRVFPRRIWFLLNGLVLGLVAYGLSGLVDGLPYSADANVHVNDALLPGAFEIGKVDQSLLTGRQVPVPYDASVIYFGLLFFVVRWWRHAEYTRRRRVGFWSIAITMMIAWWLHMIAWYPQPLGILVAGGIAFAVQAASPWLPLSERNELARKPASVESV